MSIMESEVFVWDFLFLAETQFGNSGSIMRVQHFLDTPQHVLALLVVLFQRV